MYSLTEATELLEKSEKLWSGNTDDKQILSYNSHKIRHTLWVLEVWRHIIIKLKDRINLSDELINKAEICFILHDLGRFYQNNWERVLKNDEFIHWDESRKIVAQNWYSNDIILAIKYHDKYSIDWIFSEEKFIKMSELEKQNCIFLSNILRDADKLQNMLYSIFDIEHLSKNDVYWWLKLNDISEKNINMFIENKLIYKDDILSFWDYILSNLCFVFDINFNETIEILKFYWYFDKIFKLIEDNEFISLENKEIIKNKINKI